MDKAEEGFRGIQHLVGQSLEKCEPDQRKELIPNIQVVGGGASFSSTPDRLQKELYEADFNSILKLVIDSRLMTH